VNTPVWVFGITNQDHCGGVMNLREYPDYPCQQSCSEYIPVSYRCEVVYVPFDGGKYLPEDVPVTYIPAGRYVVTSPSFSMHYNMRLWFFFDDGSGPLKMSIHIRTDNQQYSQEDTSVQVVVQVHDDNTKEYLEVDSISGVITLHDSTQKTLVEEDWSWDDEYHYQYVWDFTNDAGECSTPKEGDYTAEVYVKKKYYRDMRAHTNFYVCYHAEIDLEFNKDTPEYALGEPVGMAVCVTDENNHPVPAGVESVLVLPDGEVVTGLSWTQTEPGIYSASYTPVQEGVHHITVGVQKDSICYLEKASDTFYVKECEKARIDLEITGTTLHEPVICVLTVTDSTGNGLSGGDIESELCIPDDPPSPIPLSWKDQGNGRYTAEYTPSLPGHYKISGTVTIFGEKCFKNSFEGFFTVTEKKLPDLVIRNEFIDVEPDPEIGETCTISVTVQNIGEADAGEFYVLVLIDNKQLGSTLVEGLAAGESIVVRFEWNVKYSGKYTIKAIADAGEEGSTWQDLVLWS
jgi:hypothetical protein